MNSVLLNSNFWKQEPLSPVNNKQEQVGLGFFDDDNLYQSSSPYKNDDIIKLEPHDYILETKAEVATQILENLENLIDLDELIKEENFLLDEKILPILEDVAPSLAISSLHLTKMENNTQSLLKEFETVYDVIEFSHETLTPPQSPPLDHQPIVLTTLEPILIPEKQNNHYNFLVPEEGAPLLSNTYRSIETYNNPVTPQTDIAHELAVVDELVRSRVEDMQWMDDNNNNAPLSPNSNSSGSSSNFGDCSSDPEWMPESVENVENSSTQFPVVLLNNGSKRKSKNYRSSPLDKKSRKKEQNKNAATRYRMKKRAEVEVILSEEKVLAQKNDDLANKITDMQREIKYLKGLMRDLFKAKGLLN